MTSSELLLTIAIPTFNRRKYLKETLDVFVPIILSEGNSNCEIFVSDNSSDDNTKQLLVEYAQKYSFIRYHFNEENVGADKNILLVLNNSNGKYVWLFGDDDLPVNGSVKNVLNIIGQHDPAYISLNFGSYDQDLKIKISNKNQKIKEDQWPLSPDEALKNIGSRMYFLGSNIINKKCYDNLVDIEKYCGTIIVHVFITLFVMRMGYVYVSMEEHIKKRAGDTPLDVNAFVRSIRRSADFANKLGYSQKYTKKIINNFLIDCFVAGLKIGANGGDKGKYLGLVYKNFRKYLLFWILIIPLQIIPNGLLCFCKAIKDRVTVK